MQRAVFLDRDGVINSDEGLYYVFRKEDFKLNEGVIEGLQLLFENDFWLFIVSNQGGVAKGYYTIDEVENLHQYLIELLSNKGISLKEIYYCPHHETVQPCICRKPSPYYILKAIKTFNINPDTSYFIGNSQRDKDAAEAAGIKSILIESNENVLPYCKHIIESDNL